MTTTEPDRRTHGMSNTLRAWTLVLTLVTCGQVLGGENGPSDPGRQPFLQRVKPVGGWHPDGGGMLHWWNPHCFPRCGGPDDYCRKPLPRACWPAYPPFYIGGPSPAGYPRTDDSWSHKSLH